MLSKIDAAFDKLTEETKEGLYGLSMLFLFIVITGLGNHFIDCL